MTSRRQMLRSSAVVGVFSFLGSVTGVLVEVSIAAHLGLSRASDTFYAAFTIPWLLTNLLKATGQFSLVPFFSSLDATKSREDLSRGFSYVLNFVLLGGCAIAGVGALAAPWVIAGLAPGFTHSESALAAVLCRWLFLILIPAGAAEALRSFLFSQGRFAVAAAGSFFRNATVIACILLGFHRYGYGSLVAGYLLGYVLQLAILGVRVAMACPVRYSLAIAGTGEAFRHLHGAARAQMGSAALSQGRMIVERIIASFLPPGTLTALHYGMKIMATFSELIAGSVGTVALPTLSRAFADVAKEEGQRAFRSAIEIELILVSPALVFCLMLPQQIIRLVFERGHFTAASTLLMSQVFFYYSLSLVFYVAYRMLTFYLFSRREHGAFLQLTTFYYGLNVALDLLFVGVFGWHIAGIPLAFFVSLGASSVIAYGFNLGQIRQSFGGKFAIYSAKALVGAVLAAAAIWLMNSKMAPPVTGLGNLLYLVETCGAGLAVFLGTLMALRVFRLAQVASVWPRSGGE